MAEPGTGPTIGGVIATFARAAGLLAGHEAVKAQEELRRKAAQAGADAGLVAAGGAVAYGGFLATLAGVALGLRRLGLPDWLAALAVGLVTLGAGGGLALAGAERLRQTDPVPRRTIETIKDDVAQVAG
jgi:hypothetical protein